MVKNYFVIAFRNLWKNRTISFINIFGLAVSMSVCLLLIVIVADQYSYDSYHQNKDRIYRIITDRTQLKEYLWSTATTAYPLAELLEQHDSVEEVVKLKSHFSGVAGYNDREIPFKGMYASNSLLSVFNFPFAKGNPASALKLANSMVLSHKLAKKLFGEEDPLDQVISVENIGDFIITGVFAELPGKTHLQFEALASVSYLSNLKAKDSTAYVGISDWSNIYSNYIYVKVKENASIKDIEPLLTLAAKVNYDPEGDFEYEFIPQPLTGITPGPLLSNMPGFGLPYFVIYIMLAVALIVLFSACFNYANLTTARAVNRAREIGMRKVVGARKADIFGQLMIEAMIIAVIAYIFADLAFQFILPKMNDFFVSTGAPVTFDETPHVYWWFFAFVLLTGLLAGLIPAIFFAGTNPLNALKKSVQINQLGEKIGFKRFDFRELLVVVQFAFSIFFVITMVTIYKQSKFVLSTDHGFTTSGIINIKLQGLEFEKLETAFKSIAGVDLVSSTTHLPALGSNSTVQVRLKGEDKDRHLSYTGVDENYLEVLQLDLLAGRNFPDNMPTQEQYIILNETAVNRYGLGTPEEAIGQWVILEENELEVIGVLKDFHYERLDEEIGPMALRYLPNKAQKAVVVINTKSKKATLAAMDVAWKELTNRPFDYTFFEDDLRLSYAHFEGLAVILTYVTAIAVSIACLGLLGMVIYHVQNKIKEIGIRKTLGAQMGHIALTVGKGFLIMILIAYAIGGPAAYLFNNAWLQTNVYRTDFGWPTLIAGFTSVLFIVMITIGSQVYRAIRINPVESLKSE